MKRAEKPLCWLRLVVFYGLMFEKKWYFSSPCCTIMLTATSCLFQCCFAWRRERRQVWARLCPLCRSSCPGCPSLTPSGRWRLMSTVCVAAATPWLRLQSHSSRRRWGKMETTSPTQRKRSSGWSFSSCRFLSVFGWVYVGILLNYCFRYFNH